VLIAHRAGNARPLLGAAVRAGADVIEADLQLRRGRLELRHLNAVGSLPLYWDRWSLAPPWRRFDVLEDLLEQAPPGAGLLLDLKGEAVAGARLLARALDGTARTGTILVSARAWPLLAEIDPAHAGRFGSAARPVQLAALLAYAERHPIEGASLHLRLLEDPRVRALQQHAPLVMTWPVNRLDEARRARALGATGLISDNLPLLAALGGLRAGTDAAERLAQRERAEGDREGDQADDDVHERRPEL
jgi:glycerophosphoryl diester phosphodiesterase